MPVVNIRNYRGNYVYIGRAGHGHDGYLGNPYPKGQSCTRCGEFHASGGATLRCFELYARERINRDGEYSRRVRMLYGQTLGCFCTPQPCHGDILLDLATELAEGYRMLVAGSPDWTDGAAIRSTLLHFGPGRLVCGDEPGATQIARHVARELKWPEPEVHPLPSASWLCSVEDHQRRNAGVVAHGAHICLAFLLRRGDAAADLVDRARAHGIYTWEASPIV